MADIILASQSPRRAELLTAMGVEFRVISSQFIEELDDTRSPEKVAKELALGKALAVAEKYPDSIVIGSDTIVTIEGRQLEKPHDEDEALDMIKSLAGKSHEVCTGLAVVCVSKGIQLVGADVTEVYFKPFDEERARSYVSTGDPLDKAGGYGIQSGAAPLIDHIEGEYDTVIGLPVKLLSNFLFQIGIEAKTPQLQAPVPCYNKP